MGWLQRWVGFDDLSERGFTLRQVEEQMLVNRFHVSESRHFRHLFHVTIPHFEWNLFNLPLLLFNSANFDIDSLFKAETFFIRRTDLRRHTNLFCKHRLTQIEGKNQTGSGDLRWSVAQELFISLHESTELACHISDLSRFLFIIVDSEDELVPLKEGHDGSKVD